MNEQLYQQFESMKNLAKQVPGAVAQNDSKAAQRCLQEMKSLVEQARQQTTQQRFNWVSLAWYGGIVRNEYARGQLEALQRATKRFCAQVEEWQAQMLALEQ